MSLDYLEDLGEQIDRGVTIYACPGKVQNDWYLAETVDELRDRVQKTANSRKYEASIYRLVNNTEVTGEDFFLIVRKILEPGPRGEPRMHWALVDTREAAELMRDVSHGPTPYFGAVIEETVEPVER